MYEAYTDIRVVFRQVTGQMFGAIDRTVLASRTAEAHHKACEPAAQICLDMSVHDPVNMFKETYYLPVIFKESYYWLVATGKFLVRLIAARIMDRSAVEHISSSVSGHVLRNAFLEGEAVDLDFELSVVA